MALDIGIRPAVPGDLPGILALVNRAYSREYWLIPGPRLKSLEALQEEFDSPGNTFLVAASIEGVHGVVRVTRPHLGSPHPEPIFGMLAVDAGKQGQGLGRSLVGAAEQMAIQSGYSELFLECLDDMGMPQMYGHLGYIVTGKSFGSRWGSTAPFTLLLMRKQLFEVLNEDDLAPFSSGE